MVSGPPFFTITDFAILDVIFMDRSAWSMTRISVYPDNRISTRIFVARSSHGSLTKIRGSRFRGTSKQIYYPGTRVPFRSTVSLTIDKLAVFPLDRIHSMRVLRAIFNDWR